MKLFAIAFQFLTILPLPVSSRCESGDLGKSMAMFPLVGLVLGLGMVAADLVLTLLFPREVVDLLLLIGLGAATGALHLDGVADVADGIAARGDRERFLEVMKDPRTGPVGAAALIVTILLKYVTLLHLPLAVKREALLLFPLLARYAQVQLTVGSRQARNDGLGAVFIAGAGTRECLIAAAIAIATSVLLLHGTGFFCFLFICAATWGMRKWCHQRLGGVTGDVIGCTSELMEIAAMLVILAFSTFSFRS